MMKKSPSPSETMGKQRVPEEVSSFGTSPSFGDHPYGRLTGRLEGPFGDQNCVRPVVTSLEELSHQHSRAHGSVSDVAIPLSTDGVPHLPLHGQSSSS